MKHKLLSILLCLAMALSLLPTAALADEGGVAANDGTEAHPYTLTELGAMTRAEYTAAQEALGGTMYVTVGNYSYDKDGVLGNGERNDTPGQTPDHSKLNAYGENGYFGEGNDGANGKNIVFVGNSITSQVTGYESIDKIGTSLLLAVPAYTNVTFKGITFNNVMSFDYQLYTGPWSQLGELKFDGCTFNGIIVGAIAAQKLTFNGCTFNDYTNTVSANNSNPTWIRPAYGNWTKGDNEGQGGDFRSLTEINFTDNTVTSTRLVKFEYISQWDITSTVTATGNHFDISAQTTDKPTKIKNVGLYLGAHTDANAFDLVVDNNTKSNNTAALYTIPEGKTSLPAGSTVKDSSGKEIELTDALKWKGNPDDGLTLKTAYTEAAVAGINGVSYGSLAEAVAAAKDGETITLLKDVTENVTIPADKSITLDLNGKNIAVTSGCAIVNKGTLTVTGSGNVTTSADESAAVANFPGATANLNGGTYSSSNWYVIKNLGTMTIDGPVTVKKPDGSTDTSSLIDNGWVSNKDTVAGESVDAQADKAKLTIKNGAFEGKSGSASCSVVKNDDYGVLEITGGTFDSTSNTGTSNATTILNWNVATISGGTFKGSYPISNGSYGNTADQGLLTISGGDFIGTSSLFGQAQGGTSGAGKVTITDGSFKAHQFGAFNYAVEISGGTFSFDPSTKVKNNGTDYIVKRAGSEGAYTYTVLAKSGLTSGVYLTDPSGALASNYYVSSTANGVWTVSYSAPYSGGSSSYDPTYSVSTPSKTENGSVTVSPKSASKGDTVTVTVKPDSGYVLETLTVTDKNGNELTLKDKGNGKYTFTMPAGKVEVKATFMEDNSMLNFFYDVPNNAYFYEAVKWAVENGITTGVGNDLFAPEQPCTRAQIVTFLWRAAGSPEPKGAASGMTDVVSGSYYEKAVAWAIENGITTGTTTSTFSPDATCTRAQAVTFLARALKAKAASAAEFSDVPTGSYFADAVAWAAANGVTEGIGGGLFGSDNDCTRGQIVTFLYRAYNK